MELIKINTNPDGTQVVSARELHTFLEARRDFSNWIKDRIKKYELIENQDYTTFAKKGEFENQTVRIEYALTLDCAKELAMVEGNDKGKKARKYFIECEKKLKETPKLTREQLFQQAFLESQNLVEELKVEVETANKTITEQAPKVEFYDKVLSSTSAYNTNLIAKELGTSAISLNRLLKDLGVQYFQNGTWVLTAKYQNKGLTKTKTFTFQSSNGETKTTMQTVWSEKGRKFIHDLLFQNGSLKTA
jgi:anti-repressor protein